MDTKNWEYFDSTKKTYLITRDRLENERIVYVAKSNSDENKIESEKFNVANSTSAASSSSSQADLHLSEDESDSEMDNTTLHKPSKFKVGKSPSPSQIVEIEDRKFYFYRKMPSNVERFFNYYENLSDDILAYIECSPFLVMPQSLILFNVKNRYQYLKSLLLSTNESLQKKWLCLALNLEVSK